MSKKRLGIDVWVNGKKWCRCAAPEGGTFTAVVGNVPRTYARSFCMAGNENESWHWQFADLKPGDKVTFRLVETDWCSEPDTVQPATDNDGGA